MKKNNSYTINHDAQTIVLTKEYSKRSSDPSSKEFKELAKLHKAFPEYDIIRRTAVITADKKKHSGLNFEMMEKYINTLATKEADLEEYKSIKAYYENSKGKYGKVKAWFLKKYPNYKIVEFPTPNVENKENNRENAA